MTNKQRVIVSVYSSAATSSLPALPGGGGGVQYPAPKPLFTEEIFMSLDRPTAASSTPSETQQETHRQLDTVDGLVAAADRAGSRTALLAAVVEARQHDADSINFMAEHPEEFSLLAELRKSLRRACEVDALLSSRALDTPDADALSPAATPRKGRGGASSDVDDDEEESSSTILSNEAATQALMSATRARRRDLCVGDASVTRATAATMASSMHPALFARTTDATSSGLNTPKTPQDVSTIAARFGLGVAATGTALVPIVTDGELDSMLDEADSLMPLHVSLVMAPVVRFRLAVAEPMAGPGTVEAVTAGALSFFDAPADVPDETTVRRLVYLIRGVAHAAAFVSAAGHDPHDISLTGMGLAATSPKAADEAATPTTTTTREFPEGLEMARIDVAAREAPYALQAHLAAHAVAATPQSYAAACDTRPPLGATPPLGRRGSGSTTVIIPTANATVYAMDAVASDYPQFTLYSPAHLMAAVAVQCLHRKVLARRVVAARRAQHRTEMDAYHKANLEESAAVMLQTRLRGLLTRKAAAAVSPSRLKHLSSPPPAGKGATTLADAGGPESGYLASQQMPSWAARPITESMVDRVANAAPEYGSEAWLTRQANVLLIQNASRKWFAKLELRRRQRAVSEHLNAQEQREVAGDDEHDAATAVVHHHHHHGHHGHHGVAVPIPHAVSGGRALGAVFNVAMLLEMSSRGDAARGSSVGPLWGIHLLHDTVNDDYTARRHNCLPQRLPELPLSRWFVSIRKLANDVREVEIAKANLALRRIKSPGRSRHHHAGGGVASVSPARYGSLDPADLPAVTPPPKQRQAGGGGPPSARLARAAKHKQLTATELARLIEATQEEVSDANARVQGRLAERDRDAREAFRRSRISLVERTEKPSEASNTARSHSRQRHGVGHHDDHLPPAGGSQTARSGTGAVKHAPKRPAAKPARSLVPRPPPELETVVPAALVPIGAPNAAPARGVGGVFTGTTHGAELRRRSLHQQQQTARGVAPIALAGGDDAYLPMGPESIGAEGNDHDDAEHQLRQQKRDYLSAIFRVHDDRLRQQRRVAVFK